MVWAGARVVGWYSLPLYAHCFLMVLIVVKFGF